MMIVSFGGYVIHLWWVVVLVFMGLLGRAWRQTHNTSHLVFLTIFLIYIFFALEIAFFPIMGDSGYVNRSEGFRFGINWIPFNWDFSLIPHIVLMQIFQNILLTVPFGFAIPFVMRIRPKTVFLLSLTVGMGIELIQLIISFVVGYTYRVIDINDAILNTFGVVIGYGLFRIFGMGFLWFTQKFEGDRKHGLLSETREIILHHMNYR